MANVALLCGLVASVQHDDDHPAASDEVQPFTEADPNDWLRLGWRHLPQRVSS
jgi:hypothetical protein